MGWSAHGLVPETGAVVIMKGDRVTKTPNNSVASPRKKVNGEGMLAVQAMICVECGLPTRSLPIYVCFLVPMGCSPARLLLV